jgi:hypothetical protein
VLAVAALMAHVPMLFVFNTIYRYAALAWDLTLLVMIVVVARSALIRRQSRAILPATEAVGAGWPR